MSTLNEQQERACSSRAARIAVIAGAGSGKTRTLIERICRIMAENPQAKTVCMTFTNAGAREVEKRLAARGVKIAYVGTLHGWALRTLNKHGHLLGYRAGGIGLLTEELAAELLQQVADFLGYKGSWKALKDGVKSAEANAGAGKYGPIAQEYQFRLKRNNLCDYDAVLVQAWRLLVNFPNVALAEQADHVLVDEGQDGAQIDWDIYFSILTDSLYVTGDPDQSVFSFRGAWPQGFTNFAKTAEMHILDLNYRSGSSICAAASRLVAHNTGRIAKDVVPSEPRESEVTVKVYLEDRLELSAVRMMVANTALVHSPSEIAILCRTNALAKIFRDELQAHGIPVAGVVERPNLPADWSATLDLIGVFHDPRNDLLAERVLKRMAPDKVEECKRWAAGHEAWLSTAGQRAGLHIPIPDKHPEGYVVATLSRNGISRESQLLVAERIATLPAGQDRLVDLLRDMFNWKEWQPAETSEGVYCGTFHSFKGREADVVFMPAFEEGIIPDLRKDTTPAQVEEYRRLAFVGITRARHRICISWARTRFSQWGPRTEQQPSRFLREAFPEEQL